MGTCESCEGTCLTSQPWPVLAHDWELSNLSDEGGARGARGRLVDVDDVMQRRGSVSVAGRYCTTKAFEKEFVVGRVLGTGKNGAVRLASSNTDGKTYAVKSFTKECLGAHRLTLLKQEAEIYLGLDHPHVTELKVVYESDGMLHIVMEHMTGGELLDRLLRRLLYPEAEAANATGQMLRALSYLHTHNIVHRDVKPENFVYESKRSSHLKLIDFGLARFWDGSCNMSWRCGSLPYAAPEVHAGSYTDKADMWSLGVIVYLLLVGTPPFPGGAQVASPRTAESNKPFRWCSQFSQLSLLAQDFVEALLEPDPVLRFSARFALAHPWLRSVDESTMGPPAIAHLLGTLRTFARTPLLMRAVLSVMAWSLPADSAASLRQQFLLMDIERTGTISHKVFKKILVGCFSVEIAEAEVLFDSLDINGSGEIDYSEFLAGSLPSWQGSVPEDVVRGTFHKFDHDGNGLISADDLRHALGRCFGGARMHDLIEEADLSGDGHISYPEFSAYFRRGAAEVGPDGTPRSRTVDGKVYL